MQHNLTRKQCQLLEYLDSYIDREGYSPSYREMARDLETSIGAIHRMIGVLEEKGVIELEYGKWRSIRLVDRTCPHCGGQL